MNDKKENYYYVEVGKNEEGEILFYYKRGGRDIYVKIVWIKITILNNLMLGIIKLNLERNNDKRLEC